ncbi:hypothetical protein EJP82_10390 [Paenibacillus anaericanus]|uniref:Mor transcription activator domain-containing protein n=1 Tax=Paenibacillus anaericanus TaxID=170367 RepID=A0A3S1EIZ6_9BACL|nr:CD3324 family protein [Paenibacillus anaericanus]RUT46649.1 hypothetical protein EJP82_10390 [Paenibacillus anaericanus]
MKYIQANVIFPENLLKEIQKYVQGEMIYIPKPEGIRKRWGENSGNREQLDHRNTKICDQFLEGATIDQLVDTFSLSYDSIKKIVYSKK